jgi:hypothetical protein
MDNTTEQLKYNSSLPPILETTPTYVQQPDGSFIEKSSPPLEIANLAKLAPTDQPSTLQESNIGNLAKLTPSTSQESNIGNLAKIKSSINKFLQPTKIEDKAHEPISFINESCDREDPNFVYKTLCNDLTLHKKFNTKGIDDIDEINKSIKHINRALSNDELLKGALKFTEPKLNSFIDKNSDIFKDKYTGTVEQNKEILERSLDLLKSKKLLLKKISIYNNDTAKVNYNDQKLNVIYKSMKNDRPMNAKESEVWYETKKGMLNKMKYFGAVLLGINNFNKYNITSAQEAFKSELIIMKVGLTVFLLILYVSYSINYDKPTVHNDPLCSSLLYRIDENGKRLQYSDGTDVYQDYHFCPATNTLLSKTSEHINTFNNYKKNTVGVGTKKYEKFTDAEIVDVTKDYPKPNDFQIWFPIVLTPLVAILSVIGMYLGRYKMSEWKEILSEHFIGMLIVFAVLFLFELAKEGSGAGRWLEKNSKDSIYKKLDNANLPGSANATGPLGGKSSGDKEGIASFFALPKYGDPFINNMAMCTFVIIGIYLTFIMVRLASLSSLGWEYFAPGIEGNIPWWHFIIELLLVVLGNALTQPFGEMIREGEITFDSFKHSMTKSSIFFIIFVLGGTMLHVSFQSIGFLGYEMH